MEKQRPTLQSDSGSQVPRETARKSPRQPRGHGPPRTKEEAPEEVQAKLNRSPTKVLLLTNVAPAKQPEETIKPPLRSGSRSLVRSKECTVVRVPDVPEEDSIRVFVVFDSIKASSKAYASLRGQVTDGRALRARFYDEKRFQDGELYKVRPVWQRTCAYLCTVTHTMIMTRTVPSAERRFPLACWC